MSVLNKLQYVKIFLITGLLMTSTFYDCPGRDEETALLFSCRATGRHYVSAIYNNGFFYLPLSELFGLLGLYHEIDMPHKVVRGKWYDPEKGWKLDFNLNEAHAGKRRFIFSADDIRIGEVELYLKPCLFEKLFNMKFRINMNALSLTLEYDGELPVEKRQRRDSGHLELEAGLKEDSDFPLVYPVKHELFKAGALNYNIGLVSGKNSRLLNYSFMGGAELLGGGLTTGIAGTSSGKKGSLKVVNTKWKYVFKKNPFITSLKAGQLYSAGIFQRRITGMALSNEPVIPRHYCNNHIVEGFTEAGSEVELYKNNRLCAFQYADEKGYYRFEFPLNYGSLRTKVKIYKPSGEITVRKERIVTPHNFLPERVVSYDFKIGILDDGFSGIGEGNYFSQGYVAGGITGNITLKAGAACFSGEQKVHYFSSVYARIKKRYLMDIYVSPGIKYGFGMEGCYPEGHNWKISYTRFPDERLLNLRLFKEELFAGFLLPFNFLNIKSGLRMSYRKKRFRKGTGSDFSGSIFARLRRITLRADYRGRFNTCSGSESYADGYAVAYVSYIFPGVHSVPFIVRGSMLNAKVAYDPVFCNLNSAGIRFSRALSGRGRFHIDFDYTFPSHSLSLHALINIYLNKFRILSVFRKMNDNYLSRQNICGSIASLSAGGEKVLWSESEQAGCAGVSVIMFVDSNENGKYDENEEIVPADAFRINRSADIKLTTEGILHIGRLVSYQSYNARIIQSEMQDPLLAPLKSSFSFIADPNRFKLIKIPLYRTGVIEGRVILQEEGLSRPAGGLKLIIEAVGNDVKKIINTFSDGSFYAMGILPGRYLLKIDKEQLDHLDLAGSPEIREIEIKACADGDFHTDINFILSHKSNPVKRERND